jgi:hypothetical protein
LFGVQEEERLHYRFSSGQGRLPVIDEKKNTLRIPRIYYYYYIELCFGENQTMYLKKHSAEIK